MERESLLHTTVAWYVYMHVVIESIHTPPSRRHQEEAELTLMLDAVSGACPPIRALSKVNKGVIKGPMRFSGQGSSFGSQMNHLMSSESYPLAIHP